MLLWLPQRCTLQFCIYLNILTPQNDLVVTPMCICRCTRVWHAVWKPHLSFCFSGYMGPGNVYFLLYLVHLYWDLFLPNWASTLTPYLLLCERRFMCFFCVFFFYWPESWISVQLFGLVGTVRVCWASAYVCMIAVTCGQSVVAAVGGTAGQPDNRVWRDLTFTTTIFTGPKSRVRLVATNPKKKKRKKKHMQKTLNASL